MRILVTSGSKHGGTRGIAEMIAVALVGAGEAIATRLSTGDTDVDGAAELMINLFWRGLKGVPTERDAAEPSTESG